MQGARVDGPTAGLPVGNAQPSPEVDRAASNDHDRSMSNTDPIAALLAESDNDRRWDLLRAFVINETAATREGAEAALVSGAPRAREVAADVLLPRLDAEYEPNVLASVIVSLGHTADLRGRSGIIGHAEHRDESVRHAVAFALPSLGLDDAALAALRRQSSDVDEDVRDWATFGLAESDAADGATIEALAARADDPHDDTRAEGILGLARRHDPRARARVERELDRPVHGALIERALAELDA
jgi:HEAT repeat protein